MDRPADLSCAYNCKKWILGALEISIRYWVQSLFYQPPSYFHFIFKTFRDDVIVTERPYWIELSLIYLFYLWNS